MKTILKCIIGGIVTTFFLLGLFTRLLLFRPDLLIERGTTLFFDVTGEDLIHILSWYGGKLDLILLIAIIVFTSLYLFVSKDIWIGEFRHKGEEDGQV